MKRAEFLAATGLDLITYKNLRHRGLIPDMQDLEGHTNFYVKDAIRMRIMLEVMKTGGLPAGAANSFAVFVWAFVDMTWGSNIEGLRHAEIWGGVGDDLSNVFSKDHRNCVAYGKVEACASELANGGRARRIFMVNVSRAVDHVLRSVEAQEAGDA